LLEEDCLADLAPKENGEKSPSKIPTTIEGEIVQFANQIDGLAETLPLAYAEIEEARKLSNKRLVKYFEEECPVAERSGDATTYTFDGSQMDTVIGLSRRAHRVTLALQLVPRSIFVALVSQFDAYVGRLIRQLFSLRPEIVDSSANALTFAQLVAFGSIEVAREYVIDKKIEIILRKSHSDQFVWFEKRFGISIGKDFPAWPVFMEVTERRHLFVHTNGVVSN
jgi:hypothetical protein